MLLLILLIGGVGVSPAFSLQKNHPQSLNIKETLHVYPSTVLESSWSGLEHVLTPDLGEDSLYQKFNAKNSAYVPLRSVIIDEVKVKPSENNGNNRTPSSVPAESSLTEDGIPASPDGVVNEEPLETENGAQVELDGDAPIDNASQIESENVETFEEVIEEESQPAEPASADQEPVVLKKAAPAFFAFLSTVSQLFPFVNTSDEVPLSNDGEQNIVEEVAPPSFSDPENDGESVDVVENVVLEQEVQSLSEEVASSTEAATDVSSSEDSPRALPSTSQPVLTQKLSLADFSTPDLKGGEFITSMQLRMSLGASYEMTDSNQAPVLDIYYKKGSVRESIGSVVIDQEISNALNGGYFLFALPQVLTTQELSEVEIEIVYTGDTQNLDGLYLDAAWLEIDVEKIDKKLLQERAQKDAHARLSDPELFTLLSDKVDFTRNELPQFSLRYASQRNIAVRFVRDLFGKTLAEVEDISFLHNDIGGVGVKPKINITEDGLLTILLTEEDKKKLEPGEYSIEITVNEGGALYTDAFSFQWGMLSINPNKTTFEIGETADISMGALTPNGNTVCDANLNLYLIDPSDVVFKTTVYESGLCDGNNVIDVPDYSAAFTPQSVGEYEMYLERLGEDGSVLSHTSDTFHVVQDLSLSLEREGPSRIYPKVSYPMDITVATDNAWKGTLIETVPAVFEVTDTDAIVTRKGDVYELAWSVDLAASSSQRFTYVFDAPDLSPFLYTLGTARLEGEGLSSLEAVVESVQPNEAVLDVEPEVLDGTEEPSAEESTEETVAPETTEETLSPVNGGGDTLESEVVQEEIVEEVTQEEPSLLEKIIDVFTPDEEPMVPLDVLETEPVEFESPSLPVPEPTDQVVATYGDSVVFEEHRQWQIASDATGNMILYWDTTSGIPSGWTCLSCGSGTFFQRFGVGSTTYNTTGGATTHTPTALGSVLASSAGSTESGTGTIAPVSHSHTYNPSIASASNLPSYRQLRVIQYTSSAGEPATIPTGAIGIFDVASSSLPSGWNRYAAQDGYYVRGEDTPGTTGGSNTHTHAIASSTSISSGAGTRVRGTPTQTTGATDTHRHPVSTTTPSINSEPPYIEVVFAKLTATNTVPVDLIAMWTADVPAGWDDKSGVGDPFTNKFIKGAATYNATGGGSSTHVHANMTGIVSDPPSATTNGVLSGTPSGSSPTHTHSVSVTSFSTTSNLPPYLSVVYGKRLSTNPIYEQLSYWFYVNNNLQTPADAWPSGATDVAEGEAILAATTPLGYEDVVRLRLNTEVSNATSSLASFKLQYGVLASTCDAVSSWNYVGIVASSSVWRGYNTSVADHGTLSTTLLASSTVSETFEENGYATTTPNDIGIADVGEWDFVLQHYGATDGTTYCFRMVEEDGTPFALYTAYPQILTNYAPEIPTPSVLFDNEKTPTTTPSFQFVTTDAEGEDLHYEIEVDNDYDFASPVIDHNTISNSALFENLVTPADKAPFYEGQLIEYTPTTALSNGTTYWWRVRAQDPSGSNTWGEWSTSRSFTVDTSLTASAWFQTTEEQFDTDTLSGIDAIATDEVELITGSSTGSIISSAIDFDDGTLGTAWGEFAFSDTESSGDIKYQIEYLNDLSAWADIPDAALAGNSTGFDTSPVSLLDLDTDTYNEIRVVGNFTNGAGAQSLQDWTIEWGYRVETPTVTKLFPNEKVGTTTPTFEFSTSDPQGDLLTYQISWSTDNTFTTGTTTRTSDTDGGFINADNGGNFDPFTSGDTIQFEIESGDALTNGSTYWWRVRAKDSTGDDAYSFWTEPRSFTASSGVAVSTWFQTTEEQFDTNILSGTAAIGTDAVTVATTATEAMLVYGEGTETLPRYRLYDGSAWSDEGTLDDVGAPITWAIVAAGTTREEYVAATVGTDNDVNVQVYALGEWNDLQEMTTSMGDISARGFDVAYETNSGDAMVAYCDGDADPSYYIWNGSTWTSGGTINVAETTNCEWIKLASDPVSDEIIIMVRGTDGNPYEAQVWSGSSWGNSTTLGSIVDADYEGMAVEYEESGGQAIIVASDGNPARFAWNSWNGSAWAGASTQAIGDDLEWATLVQDVGSDELALCYQDEDTNIGTAKWTGSAWSWAAGDEHLTTTGKAKSDPGFACAFEIGGSRDNYITTVFTNTTVTNSIVWNNTTWSTAAQINSIGDAITMGLDRTGVGLLLGTFFDETNDSLLYSGWNGSSWSTTETIEDDMSVGTSPYGRPYDVAPRNSGSEGTTIVSPGIDFNDGTGPYWDSFSWVDATPGSSNILYSVQYYNTASSAWQFIPDSQIPGNSAGTTTSPIDLSGLDVSTYDLIRPYAELSCSGVNCPTLSDWTVTWAEGITITGTAQQYDRSTNVTSGTVAVAVNGELQTGKTGSISGGTWSISNVTAFAGDVLTFFISGASDSTEAVAVTAYDGSSDMSGVALYERHLSIGSDDRATVHNAGIELYDFTNTEDIFVDVDVSNDLDVCATTGCFDARLIIKSGNTYQPGAAGDVITHDLVNNGTLLLNGNTMRLSGSWDNNATTTAATSTVIFTATSTSESIDDTGAVSPSFYNLTLGETSGSATWTLGSTLDVNNTLTVSYGTFARGTQVITIGRNLVNALNGVWTGMGTTTFDGATASTWSDASAALQNIGRAVIDGTTKTITLGSHVKAQTIKIGSDDTLDASTSHYNITLYGNWINQNTFNPRNGTVIFAATTTNRVITAGGDNFYNLSFTGAGGAYSFTESTLGVSNDFSITAGTVTMPTATTTIAGSFSNAGTFAHNNSLLYFTSGSAETLTLGGTAFTNAFYNARFTGSGSWTFTESNATTSNLFRITQGTVTLPSGTLTVGDTFTNSGGTFVHNSGTVKFISGASESIDTNSSFNSLLFAGSGSFSFVDASVTALGSVTISAGTLTMPSTLFTIGGSLTNNATLSHNNSTVLFNSTDAGETINLGNSSLYNMTFNSASGGWTVEANATTTNNTTLTAASSFALSSGQRLSVGGTFTNSVGGASTTWTGSTLSLEAGSYSLNAKANSGDAYETLIVKANTDIKMWNSSAAAYTVDATGSLYSQDHNAVDGDLYIYGNYPRSSGTEYWSGAYDFDGTALGGSGRQVDVRFASGASASLSNSTLHIVGSSTATTTIANQGSGTYTVSVTSGTTTAQYYNFANLGTSGVSLLSANEVTSLANGVFSPGIGGGTGLTLSSTTIDANPALQIYDVNFSTTSAIAASNVTQIDGTPSSYWWFRDSTGNIDGEDFDLDPDMTGNPGTVRWDDSALQITITGSVYDSDKSTLLTATTCNAGTPVRIVVENGATYDGPCAGGTYSIGPVTVVGDPVITVFLNDGPDKAVAVTKTPTANITDLDLYVNHVITRHEDVSAMTIEDMSVFDSTDDSDVLFTAATGTVHSLTTFADTELFVWATTTFTPSGSVTLMSGGTGNAYDGSLHIDNGAVFTGAGTTTYSVGGNFTLDTNASFIAASTTIEMTATTSGKAIDVALGETVTFNELQFIGVDGEWNLNGDISATADIEVATGTVTGTGNILLSHGSIFGDGLLSLGSGTTTLYRTNTLGGTQEWTFYNLALGNGSVVGTTTPASAATTTISGRLTIATAHYLDAGSSHFDLAGTGTVFVENGTFLQDTSTIRYSGGSATNLLSTTYYNLILNAGAGTPTYTAVGLGIAVTNDLNVGGDSPTTVNFTTNDSALDVNGNFTIASNGTLIASNSGALTIAGNYDNNGTLTHSGGVVTFDGSVSSTIAAGNSSFGSVIINGSGNFSVTEPATSTSAFTLTAAGDFTLSSGQTLAVGGVFTNAVGGASTTWTGSTLRLYSGTNYQINAKTINDAYNILSVAPNTDIRMWNSSAATYTVDATGSLYSQDHNAVNGDLYIYGNYPGNGGTDYWNYARDFDGTSLSGSERQVDVRFASGASAVLTSGGLQVLGAGVASTSVQNQGSGTYTVRIGGTASTSWSYYDIEDTNSSGLTFSGTPNIVTLSYGDIEVSQGGGSAMTVGGTAISTNPAKTFTNNIFATTTAIAAFNVTATGTSVSSWRFTNHGGNIDGEAKDVDPDGNPGYITWDDSAATITVSGNVYSDEGSTVSGVCDGSTSNIHLRVAGLTSHTTSCDAGTGFYIIYGVNYTVGNSVIVYIDGESEKGATVTEDPVSNINSLHIYENRVIVRHESTDSLSIADMAVWDSSDDADIPFTAVDAGTDTLTLPADRKLLVWTSKEFEPNGNVTLSGGGGGSSYDGTLEAQNNAIVTFAGTQTHAIGGSFIFGSGATFDAGQSTTTFTTTGAARTIDVNSEGFYNIAFTGSGSWSIADATLDVHSAFITNGSLTLPTGTTTVGASWSNNGGAFTVNGSTIVFTSTASGNVVRGGGSNFEELRYTGSGGSWSMTDTNATSTGSVIISAGTVSLPSGIFAVGGDFRNVGGTITHNTSELVLSNATTATVRAASSDLYAVTFNGAGAYSFTDASLTLLDDLRILQGSVTLATGTLSIGGSLLATGGTFAHASGTILFNSTDTGETINTGSSSFYNVVFGSGTGGWTIAAHATTTRNFTLTTASSFTQTSGTRLYVGNVFTNSVGGSATTWAGSTLVLNSGSEYAMNTKSAGGDDYQTLTIGANTDISAWNSKATTTNVALSGSLYSQDHAASNGALYIFGDYHVSTTTAYWSYATDFDGTSLSGSERAVTVSLASNATTSIDGGVLNIIGASGNETTITNQGSGTYAMNVSDGTFNAQYYEFRNLNATGLNFTEAPTISSLSYGDFELAVNGGSLITLSTTTLDANASFVITGNRFATTSAITGENVTLIGTTSNAWTFVAHTGNLSGEDYDSDGATDCGSLRWSDSSCLITQQTHFRWRNDDGGAGVPDTEWFDSSWQARKSVRLQNADATTYTDGVFKIEVAYDADMQSNFADLRFTDASGTTSIPYFIERYTASTDADVWVKVPTLTADDTTLIYMYYDNTSATTTSSSTVTFIAADDFEDGNIAEYTGANDDKGLFTVDGTFAYGGSYGLDNTGNEESRSNDGGMARFDQTVSQGEIIRYLQYVDTTDGGDEVCTLFGVQSPVSANQNYAVCLEQVAGTDYIAIAENVVDVATNPKILASTSVTYSTGWYEVEIDWQTDDDIVVTLLQNGSVVTTVSDNDPSYTSGGFGFTYWFNNGGWDNFTSRLRVDTEPTVRFGAEQTDGGASWKADIDSPGAYIYGDVARLRIAVENSGLQITSQTYDIEFAEKGAAPSCEAVAANTYTQVPLSASCGSSAICMATSTYVADNDATTDLLVGPEGDYTAGRVVEDPSNTTAALTIDQDAYTELEYVITPTVNASESAYCLRISDDGDPVDTYLSVAEMQMRFDPQVSTILLNGGSNITLTPGTTTTVYATGTATDLNGYSDLNLASSTIYRSGAGPACSPDNNNCYISQGAPLCTFSDCSGNSCTVSCQAEIYFHADATDESPYLGEEWLAFIEVTDMQGGIDIGSSDGVELLSLRALDVTSEIDYGSLAVSSTTGSYNPTTTVQNLGNLPIDINLEGTDLTDDGSSVIPANEQIFATSTFNYTACTNCSPLSSTSLTSLEVDLSKPTSSSSPIVDIVYWGIEIPFGVASNPHAGTNIFYAISDD